MNNTLAQRVFGKGLLVGLAITACVMPELDAAASSINAYYRRLDASVYTATSSPVYLPNQWAMTNEGRLRGFVRAANGLSVAASANVYLDLFQPLSGQISLGNSSTLNLESDLFLTSSASLSVGSSGATLASSQAVAIHLGGDFTHPGSRTIFVNSPELTIDGGGYSYRFNDESSTMRIAPGSTLTLRNMVINGLSSSHQIKGPGTLKLQNCVVNLPTSDVTWTASWGNVGITIADDVVVRGGGTFVFGSAAPLAINQNSMLSFDNNTTFLFAPQDFSRTRLTFADSSSILRLNGSTFCAPGEGGFAGVSLTNGTLLLDNKVTFSNSYHSVLANGITFGNGTASDDLAVRMNAGASINLNCGMIDYQNVDELVAVG